jgi:DNA segregation ATPase FtsK/SpoIIIE, S-DNA-T family
VRELTEALDMSRSWVYLRLQEHAADGRVTQVTRGRWAPAPAKRPPW